MTITFEEIKKRVFSLDVLSTSYDNRNRPIGARKLPAPITITMDRIRELYENELSICERHQKDNLDEHAKKRKDPKEGESKYETEKDEKTGRDVYVFKSKKAKEAFFEKEKEILETKIQVPDYRVSMEDVLRIEQLEEWVYKAIKWMIEDPQVQE